MNAKLLHLVIASTVCISALHAQSPARVGQSGITFAIGGGNGSLKIPCDCFEGYRPRARTSQSWMGRIGYANTPHSVIGIEYTRWTKTQTVGPETNRIEQVMSVSWLDVTAEWHPTLTGVLSHAYVKGAAGMGTLEWNPGLKQIKNIGGGIGVGYDIPVMRAVALTPYFDFLAMQKVAPKPLPVGAPSSLAFGTRMYVYGIALKFNGVP